jgi:Leucine-rich repeat (LRR) protein
MAHVRSVAVFGNNIVDLVPLVLGSKVLRVLALEDSNISDIGCVDNMLHLRYLGLRHTQVDELPVDIGNLHFLQTLDLRESRKIQKLPSSIVLLRNLMCLIINQCIQLPSGVDCLTSFEVLEGLQVGHPWYDNYNLDIVKELCHLTKLRVLQLFLSCSDENMQQDLMKSLSNLHKLESLHIVALHVGPASMHEGWVPPPQLRILHLDKAFKSLPSWISPTLFPLLSYLLIRVRKLHPH